MKRPRISIAGLMAAVALVAIDIAVVQSIYPEPKSELQFFYAFGVLPMATVLILLGAFSAPNLVRGGSVSPFVFGFEAVGWVVVFIFISAYTIAPNAFSEYGFAMLASIASPFNAYLEESPNWAQVSVGIGIATAVLTLPQLLLALLGGWLARRLKLTVRFERG